MFYHSKDIIKFSFTLTIQCPKGLVFWFKFNSGRLAYVSKNIFLINFTYLS